MTSEQLDFTDSLAPSSQFVTQAVSLEPKTSGVLVTSSVPKASGIISVHSERISHGESQSLQTTSASEPTTFLVLSNFAVGEQAKATDKLSSSSPIVSSFSISSATSPNTLLEITSLPISPSMRTKEVLSSASSDLAYTTFSPLSTYSETDPILCFNTHDFCTQSTKCLALQKDYICSSKQAFACSILFKNWTFISPDLYNPESEIYKNLTDKIRNTVIEGMKLKLGDDAFDIVMVGFRPGSVVAYFTSLLQGQQFLSTRMFSADLIKVVKNMLDNETEVSVKEIHRQLYSSTTSSEAGQASTNGMGDITTESSIVATPHVISRSQSPLNTDSLTIQRTSHTTYFADPQEKPSSIPPTSTVPSQSMTSTASQSLIHISTTEDRSLGVSETTPVTISAGIGIETALSSTRPLGSPKEMPTSTPTRPESSNAVTPYITSEREYTSSTILDTTTSEAASKQSAYLKLFSTQLLSTTSVSSNPHEATHQRVSESQRVPHSTPWPQHASSTSTPSTQDLSHPITQEQKAFTTSSPNTLPQVTATYSPYRRTEESSSSAPSGLESSTSVQPSGLPEKEVSSTQSSIDPTHGVSWKAASTEQPSASFGSSTPGRTAHFSVTTRDLRESSSADQHPETFSSLSSPPSPLPYHSTSLGSTWLLSQRTSHEPKASGISATNRSPDATWTNALPSGRTSQREMQSTASSESTSILQGTTGSSTTLMEGGGGSHTVASPIAPTSLQKEVWISSPSTTPSLATGSSSLRTVGVHEIPTAALKTEEFSSLVTPPSPTPSDSMSFASTELLSLLTSQEQNSFSDKIKISPQTTAKTTRHSASLTSSSASSVTGEYETSQLVSQDPISTSYFVGKQHTETVLTSVSMHTKNSVFFSTVTSTTQNPHECSTGPLYITLDRVTSQVIQFHWMLLDGRRDSPYLVSLLEDKTLKSNSSTNSTSTVFENLHPGNWYTVSVEVWSCGRKIGSSVTVRTEATSYIGTARIKNEKHLPEYSNSSSTAFQEFHKNFTKQLEENLPPAFQELLNSGKIRIVVTGIREGSVIVTFDIVMVLNGTVTHEEIEHAIIGALNKSRTLDVDFSATSIKAALPCQTGYNGCSENAVCLEVATGYTCQCKTGFQDQSPKVQGRHCQEINECMNNPCSSLASCTNTIGSYQCQCYPGITDLDTRNPGRVCQDPVLCFNRSDLCSETTKCLGSQKYYICSSKQAFACSILFKNWTFISPDLYNPESVVYKNLTDIIRNTVIKGMTVKLGDESSDVIMVGFRPGSVIAYFTFLWQGQQLIKVGKFKEDLTEVVKEMLDNQTEVTVKAIPTSKPAEEDSTWKTGVIVLAVLFCIVLICLLLPISLWFYMKNKTAKYIIEP
ncbi:uncharacterized protein LOC110074045 [Pogona vitticeps]